MVRMRSSRLAVCVLLLGAALLVSPVPVLTASGAMGPVCAMHQGTRDCCGVPSPATTEDENGCSTAPCCRMKRPLPSSPALVDAAHLVLAFVETAVLPLSAPATGSFRIAGEVPARSRTVPLFLLHSTLLI